MNYRERKILTVILNKQDGNTVSDLAASFQVSARTIRNDITNINDFLKKKDAGILQIEGKGKIFTYLNKDAAEIRKLQEGQTLYDEKLSKNERVSLLSIILAVTPGYITLAQMTEMMYASKATVVKDMEAVREKLDERHIRLFSYPNKGYRVSGKESDIRELLWNEQESTVILHFFEEIFSTFKTVRQNKKSLVNKIIEEQEHAHDYYLTDHSYDKLALYMQIMIWRIAEGCLIEKQTESESEKEFQIISEDITKYVYQYCGTASTEDETLFLTKILGKLRYLRNKEKNQEIVHIQIVTRQFIEKVSKDLKEDLEVDYDLFENLVNHLAAIFQTEKTSFSQDSIFYEIAKQNPLVYRVVADNQYVLEDYANRKLSEVETIYITIHICAALERRKKQDRNVRAILVCHGGIGSSQLLAAKLRNNFEIQIVDIMSAHELQYISSDYADLIISTIPLENPPIEYIQISILLEERDFLLLKNRLELIYKKHIKQGVKRERNEKVLINKLKNIIYSYEFPGNGELARKVENEVFSYFHKDRPEKEQSFTPYLHQLLTDNLIQLDVDCTDWKDAIRKAGKLLLDNGFIEERYIDAMIENIEVNGPYIIVSPGFAIPHADLDAGSLKTGLAMIRLKQPVQFGEDASTIAEFVCCLCAVDYKTHVKALINLVNILANEKFKSELKEAINSEEAARVIREYEYVQEEKGLE